jgi:zinc protease
VIVFVEPNFDLPLVSVSISFRTGAASDPAGKEGLARLCNRMLRRGTSQRSAADIENRIDSLGGEFAGDVGLDSMVFYGEVISRNLEPFANLVAEIIGDPSFPLAEFDKLKRQCEGELMESRDNDRLLASRAFRRTMFHEHLYGRRLSGTLPTIQTLQREELIDFYKNSFHKNNAIVSVTGAIDEEQGQALAQQLLAKLPEGKLGVDPVTEPTMRPGRHLVFVDKPERTQMQMVIGTMGTHPSDDDHTALHVANTVFGGTFTARLTKEVRAKRGWSYGAYSSIPIARHREAFSMWTAPGSADAPLCLKLELQLLEKFCAKGISPRELSFAKSFLTRSYVFDIDTASKRVMQRVQGELLQLPADYHSGYVERVKAVSLEEANEAVHHRLLAKDLVIAVVGTHKLWGKKIEKAIDGLTSSEVLPFDFE